jgi:hypothetical protein
MTHSTPQPLPDDEIVRDLGQGAPRRGFIETEARAVAAEIGLDLDVAEFDVDAFRRGMDVELEHGMRDPETNVTNDDPKITGMIAWAHLKELPDYYERLEAMERVAEGGTLFLP